MSEEKKVIRTSRKGYLSFYFMIIIIIALIIYVKIKGLPFSEPLFVLAILFVVFTIKFIEVHRILHHYDITPSALEKVEGFFVQKVKRMHYYSISNLHLTQSLWDKLLGIGTIEISQFSETIRTEIKKINKPKEFIREMSDMIGQSGGRGIGQT